MGLPHQKTKQNMNKIKKCDLLPSVEMILYVLILLMASIKFSDISSKGLLKPRKKQPNLKYWV